MITIIYHQEKMRCIIDTCDTGLRHKDKSGISSHRFPKNPEKRAVWLKILDPTGTQYRITDNTRLCSLHFQETDFDDRQGRRKLNHNAVPCLNLGEASQLNGSEPCTERDPWDIPKKPPQRRKKPEKVWIRPIRYAGALKNSHLDQMSPRLAKHVLPKIFKQIQMTTIRLNRYKQQCLYFRKQAHQLKSLLIEMSAQHGIPIPSGVQMPEPSHQDDEIRMQMDSDVEDPDPDPLSGEKVEISGEKVEIKIEPPELAEDVPDVEEHDDAGEADCDNDEDEEEDEDYLGVRLEDEAVEKLMAVL